VLHLRQLASRQENCAFDSFANPSKSGNATDSVTPIVRSSLIMD
jgi:hypothetical protein